ncbi:Gsm1p [Kluyveromyces lactis]|uniref:Glucose starvation modulator protein 1 n=1 Tax=Kluyveromyces lactis (strain ATCC 8585 / CBS 2359 / DSM 70799 / NBRC 1267 / NRRL Y-1140 / WM37) TaxID=284590 RepID=GSM1_KLULA|nr:uncharacterized protein KLLA0_F13904g [Kluyveromyces lactis]Q6CK33.1 RecName: Full=Glucose starvation modulator protein 1 [Kluyveromyces lactis NRRL Y-1140]CAG98414.1 KLLA0F13904p [Kluyveromyces lactis]|eukprot:XP_455706.1 uncharacterized protein KLLA0_F13904g [Kluyveromyces lactis]
MTKKLTAQEKLNRKPIPTACVFCHEKHLQCDLGRPCQNCSKRGIGDTCRDKERKPRKRGPRKVKKEREVSASTKSEISNTINQQLIPVINTATAVSNRQNSSKIIKAKQTGVSTKKTRISKLAMDSLPLQMPVINSPSDMFGKQKKVMSPELPKIPSLTQLFNPTAEPIISDALLPSNQNSAANLPSLADKTPLEEFKNKPLSERAPQQGPQQPAQQLLPIPEKLNSDHTSSNSSTGEFGSVWTTEEYTKLNDMLSTPNLSRNNSKTYLNSNIAWSPSNMMKMDPITESQRPINTQELLNLTSNGLKRTHSRPHISLDQMASESKRHSANDTSPESQGGETVENLSPYRFRLLVKTPEDLYKHQALIQPHNYKSAYLELLRFLRWRFINSDKPSSGKSQRDGPEQLQNIAHSIKTHYAPIFVTLTNSLIAQDLKLQEIILQRALLEYESMAKLVNCTPMCIWRRSGEICFASNEFISLTGFNKKEILNKRKFIMEFMDNESIVDYYDIFHEYLAFGSTQSGPFNSSTGTSDGQAIFSECNLLLKNGCYLRCACIWTVKRDAFNIPMLIMGQFLPIFDIE